MVYLLIFSAFLAGFLLISGVNLVLNDVFESNRQRVRKRMEEEVLLRQKERARSSMAYKELYEMAAEGLTDIEETPSLRDRLIKLVDESGMRMGAASLLLIAGGTGLAAGLLLWLLTGSWVTAAVAALVGCAVPVAYVAIQRMRRMKRLLAQLPEAFDLMARTMRSGQTIAQALQGVADEFPSPIADEFRYCCEQQNLGLSPEAALRDLARRTGLLELKIFVLAVMIHRQTGGNLSQLLQKLSTVIRERYRIFGAIQSLTAEGRLQMYILLALPPGMLVAMLVVNRTYALMLFEYPALLAGMFASMTIGGLWMRQIINFDF